MKRMLLLFALAVALFPAALYADYSEHEDFRPFKQHIQKALESFSPYRLEFRTSEPIKLEAGQKIPVEISFGFYKSVSLVSIIEKLEALAAADLSLRVAAINVSASAEFRQSDGETLLYATLIGGAMKGKPYQAMAKTDIGLIRDILAEKTFNFAVRRGEKVEGIDMWLTNLRQDSDNRLSLSAYCFKVSDLTAFLQQLSKSHSDREIMIGNIASLRYSGIPVLRCDIYASPGNGSKKSLSGMKVVEELAKAAASTGGNLKYMRVSPAIIDEKFIEMPVEITVEDLISDEWKKVKEAISDIKIDRHSIEIVEDKGLQDEGHTLLIKVKAEL